MAVCLEEKAVLLESISMKHNGNNPCNFVSAFMCYRKYVTVALL